MVKAAITRQPPGKGPAKPSRKRAKKAKNAGALIAPKQPPGKGPGGEPKRKRPTPPQ